MMEINEFLNDKNKTFSDVSLADIAPPSKWAENIAKKIASAKEEMKTTQLRKVFAAIKNLELKVKGKKPDDKFNEPELYMLIPHLAYAKGRKFIPKDFYEMMKKIIGDENTGKIRTVADFKRFADFMTAIIAYHKEASAKKGGYTND